MSRDGPAPGLKPISAGGGGTAGGPRPWGPVAEWGWPQTFSSWPPNLAQLQLLELIVAPNMPQRAGAPWGVAEGGEGTRFVEGLEEPRGARHLGCVQPVASGSAVPTEIKSTINEAQRGNTVALFF